MKIKFQLLLCFLAILYMTSCASSEQKNTSSSNSAHSGQQASKDKTAALSLPGTKEMIDSLDAIYARCDFSNHPYEFDRQIEQIKTQMKGNRNPQLLMQFAYVNLQSGNSDVTIETLEEVIAQYKFPVEGQYKRVYDLLAIAYLRMAEQANCIINHVPTSCIIPIAKEAIHKDKSFSLKAIESYTKILKAFPDDYQSRWLLNIAYMTIGKYPNEVPSEYLIRLEKDSDFPTFKNIAGEVLLDVQSLAGGSISEDFNNDGYVDLILSSWGMKDQLRLFLNNGKGSFQEKTNAAGLKGITGGLNIIQADYNNDGHIDVLVLRGAWNGDLNRGIQPNSLLKNNGDGTFEDVTIASGIYTVRPTQAAVWADFNLDGHLDLVIVNESNPAKTAFKSEFYENNGDGTFTNIYQRLGFLFDGVAKGVAVGDINNDRYPDLYISFINQVNFTLLNSTGQNGEIKFDNITESSGAMFPLESFPCWFFDYDNDGFDDLFVSSYDNTAFSNQAGEVALSYLNKPFKSDVLHLYRNKGDNAFENMSKRLGLELPIHTMGCNFGDLNNDGFLDFYLGTGAPDYRSIVPNRMFLNQAGKSFEDVTFSGGFGHIQKGHGVSFADFDNDGDQDIYAVMGGSVSGDIFQNALFENPIESANWISLKLNGSRANKSGHGAKIEIVVSEKGRERSIYKTVSSGGSFGANSLTQTIGLGQADKIKSIKVFWPDREKSISTFSETEFNKFYLVKQEDDSIEALDIAHTPLVRHEHKHQH